MALFQLQGLAVAAERTGSGWLLTLGDASSVNAKALLLCVGQLINFFLRLCLASLLNLNWLHFHAILDGVAKAFIRDTIDHGFVEEKIFSLDACCVSNRRQQLVIESVVVCTILKKNLNDLLSIFQL